MTLNTIEVPRSIEAERGVLGAALLDPVRVVDMAIGQRLSPDRFYHNEHATIWEAILDMHEAGIPIDLLMLGERLKECGRPDLAASTRPLVDAVGHSAHAQHYIGVVNEKWRLREVLDVAHVLIEKCSNPDFRSDIVLAEGSEAMMQLEVGGDDDKKPWSEVVAQQGQSIIDYLASPDMGPRGLATGILALDGILGGLKPTDLVVLAARPSMGKTALALNIAEHVAGAGGAVGVFSMEMSVEQLVDRMICGRAGVSILGRTGHLSREDHSRISTASSELQALDVRVDDTARLDALDLRARARRMHRRTPLNLVIIDYLQLMTCRSSGRENRNLEVAAISGHLKALAKELCLPVLCLSQLNRAPDSRNGNARLSDLRDSGSIEQDADVVMLLRRPSRYKDDPEADDELLAYVQVEKHRNGPTGEAKMQFDAWRTKFSDYP